MSYPTKRQLETLHKAGWISMDDGKFYQSPPGYYPMCYYSFLGALSRQNRIDNPRKWEDWPGYNWGQREDLKFEGIE